MTPQAVTDRGGWMQTSAAGISRGLFMAGERRSTVRVFVLTSRSCVNRFEKGWIVKPIWW